MLCAGLTRAPHARANARSITEEGEEGDLGGRLGEDVELCAEDVQLGELIGGGAFGEVGALPTRSLYLTLAVL